MSLKAGTLFLNLLLLSQTGAADLDSDCRAVAHKELLKSAQRKMPGIPPAVLKTQVQDGLAAYPSARYLVEVAFRVCMADAVKNDILAMPLPSVYCPNNKSQHKISCYREWIAGQKVNYTTEALALTAAAVEVSQADEKSGSLDTQTASPMRMDAALLAMEKISTVNNVAFKPVSGSQKAEQQLLQKQERKQFYENRNKLIEVVLGKLTTVKENVTRMPAKDGAMKEWLEGYVKNLEARAKKLRGKGI